MTIDEFMVKHQSQTMLTPNDVGEIMQIHPSNVIAYARAGKLPFPHVESGNRVKFPKGPFINWMTTGVSQADEPSRPELMNNGMVTINFSGDTVDDMIGHIIEFLTRMNALPVKSALESGGAG